MNSRTTSIRRFSRWQQFWCCEGDQIGHLQASSSTKIFDLQCSVDRKGRPRSSGRHARRPLATRQQTPKRHSDPIRRRYWTSSLDIPYKHLEQLENRPLRLDSKRLYWPRNIAQLRFSLPDQLNQSLSHFSLLWVAPNSLPAFSLPMNYQRGGARASKRACAAIFLGAEDGFACPRSLSPWRLRGASNH